MQVPDLPSYYWATECEATYILLNSSFTYPYNSLGSADRTGARFGVYIRTQFLVLLNIHRY
jgi:hypothetical protein